MVNSFRLSANRINLAHDESPYFDATNLGINAFTYVPGYMILAITGTPTIGAGRGSISGQPTLTWRAMTIST